MAARTHAAERQGPRGAGLARGAGDRAGRSARSAPRNAAADRPCLAAPRDGVVVRHVADVAILPSLGNAVEGLARAVHDHLVVGFERRAPRSREVVARASGQSVAGTTRRREDLGRCRAQCRRQSSSPGWLTNVGQSSTVACGAVNAPSRSMIVCTGLDAKTSNSSAAPVWSIVMIAAFESCADGLAARPVGERGHLRRARRTDAEETRRALARVDDRDVDRECRDLVVARHAGERHRRAAGIAPVVRAVLRDVERTHGRQRRELAADVARVEEPARRERLEHQVGATRCRAPWPRRDGAPSPPSRPRSRAPRWLPSARTPVASAASSASRVPSPRQDRDARRRASTVARSPSPVRSAARSPRSAPSSTATSRAAIARRRPRPAAPLPCVEARPATTIDAATRRRTAFVRFMCEIPCSSALPVPRAAGAGRTPAGASSGAPRSGARDPKRESGCAAMARTCLRGAGVDLPYDRAPSVSWMRGPETLT